jgi:tRNA threonylcarbamoyladenosine biosynthesis protein TsaB
MRALLIDTCGANASVALADTAIASPIVASATLPGRSAAEQLIATIRALTQQHNVPLNSLGAIGVVNGPGSFTGVRVGLSAAKGLCEALALPLIAVSRLAVLASLAPAQTEASFTLLDAGRKEFFLREYSLSNHATESLVTHDELTALYAATTSVSNKYEGLPSVLICEPSLALSLATMHPMLLREPTATDALPLIADRFAARHFDDVATLDANYLRRTDAEITAKLKQHALSTTSA